MARVWSIRGLPLLRIEETTRSGVVTLTLHGELDSATAPLLDEALDGALAKGRLGIAVEIATLEFIGAAGFRSLESAQRAAKSRGLSFVVVASNWQLRIASVVSDLELTIRLVEGPEGWQMRGPRALTDLGLIAA